MGSTDFTHFKPTAAVGISYALSGAIKKSIKSLSDLSSSFRSRKERCVVVVWRVMDSSVYWIFTKCDPSSVLMLRFDNFQYALLSVLFVVVQCIVIALMVR